MQSESKREPPAELDKRPLVPGRDRRPRKKRLEELDADLTSFDGRPAYRILWVTVHGRRMDMIIDAETGTVLSER